MARIDQVAKSLVLPDGRLHALREKDVHVVGPEMIQILSRFHLFAAEFPQVSIVCRRCDHAITGQNNDSAKTLSVACLCTEWRFIRG